MDKDRLQDDMAALLTRCQQAEAAAQECLARLKMVEDERDRLLSVEREQRLLAETLAEVTLVLASKTRPADVLEEIIRQAQRIVYFTTANIALVEGGTLRTVRWQGYNGFGAQEMISKLLQSVDQFRLDAEAIETQRAVIVPDTGQEPRWVTLKETAWIRSYLVMPISLRGQVLGVLRLDGEQASMFSPEDANRLAPFASAAATALEKARLYEDLQQELVERRRAEELYRTLVRTSPDAVTMTDLEGRITFVSPRTLEMHGYDSPDELMGRSAFDLIAPEDRQRAARNLQRTVAEGAMWGMEYTLLRKDGTGFVGALSSAAILDEAGRLTALIATTRDISARKYSEERLRASEETLRHRNEELELLNRTAQLFNSFLDIDQVLESVLEQVRLLLEGVASSIWLVDPDTAELVCRQATGPQKDIVRGWRLSPGEGVAGWVVSHRESVLVTDVQDDPRYFSSVEKRIGITLRSILSVPLIARGEAIGALQVLDSRAGRFGPNDLRLVELVASRAAVAVDNAWLYRQALLDAQTKSTLLNEVNHRVKNNLSAIAGLLYAERDHVGVENRAAYQAIMKDLVNRIQTLATVHNMLSTSEWAPLLLSDLSTRVIRSALQLLPPDKEIAFTITPSSARVTADQAHNLALVINELATNTVKYALEGRTKARIAVHIALEDGDICIEFRDDGPGYSDAV
ncbi:MAG: GAF domain-containing protein, partial [Anaerolineae bacterium]|nr:GAF domain-containing protein [Anaerolineae bacterium]